MLDGLLTAQIRGDDEIAGMLAKYRDKPAFFYQKAPQDTDPGWEKPTFPRIDYNIDMSYDPERKCAGVMAVNVWVTIESLHMPEDIEKRIVTLVSGTFYSIGGQPTVCAVWSQSDFFDHDSHRNITGDTSPEAFGVTILFDLLSFPPQITTDPDPVQGLNAWTKAFFPDMRVVGMDKLPEVWKPVDNEPAIYWRFEGTTSTDRQAYAVNWYTGEFAAHVICNGVDERNRWTKAIIEQIQLDGEVVLADGSPMFAKQIKIRHAADPLREGQMSLTGSYGVLAQQRKETAQPTLNRVGIAYKNIGMEVILHGRTNE